MPITNDPIRRPAFTPLSTSNTANSQPTTTVNATTTAHPTTRSDLHATHFAGTVEGAQRRSPSSRNSSGSASVEGFSLLAKVKQVTRKQMTMAALGLALLMPPGVGQMLHPGVSPSAAVKSPVAMQMQQKSETQNAASVNAAMQRAVSQVGQGTGAARESAVGNVIGLYTKAQTQAQKAHSLLSDASATMSSLKNEVGVDARMGFVVDLYWFGVPDAHQVFHHGQTDLASAQAFTNDLDAAVKGARTSARGEVSKLLVDESPAFASLKSDHDLTGTRLEVAKKIERLADRAGDKLSAAHTYITLRNITPETIKVDDYTTRTITENGQSRTVTEKTGSHEETNPAWSNYNMIAMSAKADAEGAIRELNGTIAGSKSLLTADLKGVDANVLGVLDFFRQPSFGLWSYDSFNVSDAQSKVKDLEVSAARLVGHIQPRYDSLDTDMNHQIDVRWGAIVNGSSRTTANS
jgi:hypothetical protein